MFIRKTHILNRITQKSYWNYQLVESVRTEKGPRQRILLNLGTDLDLTAEERKTLANRIEEVLSGVISLVPASDKIEEYAQKYAGQIKHQLFSSQESQPSSPSNLQMIDINSLDVQEPKSVGAEHLLLHVARQLGIPDKLKGFGFSEKEAALAMGSIIGRAAFPASERGTYLWLRQRTGLGELLDFDFQKTSLNQLYSISDRLLEKKEALENHLEHMQHKVHGINSTLVLYDLSNTYMEGQAKSNPKAKHGLSKEKRTDCPLITLGLIIDEHGFAKRTSFFPGNISEPKTLKQAIFELNRNKSLVPPIVVLDAGIATEDNLSWLRQHKYHYIVSARQNAPHRELAGPLESVGAHTTQVKAAFIQTDQAEEQWLYCESQAKAHVTSQMKTLFRQRLETDLQKLAEGLTKPRGRKHYCKVIERVGRLREKHKAVSSCYDITVEPSEDKTKAIALHWTAQDEKLEERLSGHYFLRTTLTDLSPKDLWTLYGNLRVVEDAFRFMKSSLGMRPIYHHKEHRVDGHLWITILAYHLIQSCLHEFKKQGIHEQWQTVSNTLSTRVRVTVQAKTTDNKTVHRRMTTQVEPHQRRFYQALNLSPQILKGKQCIL